MNAKKIMGAVLVALLAVTAFAGAGAAAADEYYGTYFIYQDYTQSDLKGPWSNEAGFSFNADQYSYIPVIPEGKYVNATGYIYVQKASAPVSGVLYADSDLSNAIASFIGGSVKNGQYVEFTVDTKAELYFTTPSGIGTTTSPVDSSTNKLNGEAGTWTVQALFKTTTDEGIINPIAPLEYRLGEKFTFTIEDDSNKVELDKDTVLKNNAFFITVSGTPGKQVQISADSDAGEIMAAPGQLAISGDELDLANGVVVNLNGEGQAIIGVTSSEDGKFTITAKFTQDAVTQEWSDAKTVKITVNAGEITAEAAEEFYYLGNEVELTGTNTESKKVWFYIKGNNMDLTQIKVGADVVTADVKADKTWEKEFDAVIFQDFDAGTYTIYAVSTQITGGLANVKWSEYTYATVSLPLKQPFLTAELSATTVAQDSDLIITGTAESADNLLLYIFGNNYFNYTTITVDDDGTYEKKLTIDGNTMATGQYFVVIQHPMYNKEFNIMPLQKAETKVGEKASFDIVINTTAQPKPGYDDGAVLFNTLKRQSSNAAEALCQALDTQNIDDVYVKASFIVAQPTATMNPVSDVAKGAKLVVSGTSNMAPGTVVTVEMLSTAFAAIPKESVNSASFITLTTKVQDDGTWEVTFDTSGLNVDEYTLAATVGDIKTSTTVVKVLESAPVTPEQPTDKPEQPTDKPEQPTEPETPGFGALAALAGLGAVAVLLLRRE